MLEEWIVIVPKFFNANLFKIHRMLLALMINAILEFGILGHLSQFK
jgi:hypothetical protein